MTTVCVYMTTVLYRRLLDKTIGSFEICMMSSDMLLLSFLLNDQWRLQNHKTKQSVFLPTQEICNLCWSLVALDLLEGGTLTALAARLEQLSLVEGLTEAQAHQLLLAEEACPDALPREVHLKAWRVSNARTMDHHISRLPAGASGLCC